MEFKSNVELIKIIQAMKNKMESMDKKIDAKYSTYNKNCGNRKILDDPTFTQCTSNIYCWTHDRYAYESKYCNPKASVHTYQATFANKMDGSKASINKQRYEMVDANIYKKYRVIKKKR